LEDVIDHRLMSGLGGISRRGRRNKGRKKEQGGISALDRAIYIMSSKVGRVTAEEVARVSYHAFAGFSVLVAGWAA